MEGWIKVYRSCLDHWLYNEYRPLTKREAWENILLWANFHDCSVLIKGQLIECKRGQILYSLETYSQKFIWTVGQVRSFFELLKKDGMIQVEGLKYTTRLTICNYDKYQDLQQTPNKLPTSSQHPADILTTFSQQHTKNDKKEKNDKNDKKFMPPSKNEIQSYFLELDLFTESEIEAERFFDYYESNGWHVGKKKMKCWKAACRNWKKNYKTFNKSFQNIKKELIEPNKDIVNNPNRLSFK